MAKNATTTVTKTATHERSLFARLVNGALFLITIFGGLLSFIALFWYGHQIFQLDLAWIFSPLALFIFVITLVLGFTSVTTVYPLYKSLEKKVTSSNTLNRGKKFRVGTTTALVVVISTMLAIFFAALADDADNLPPQFMNANDPNGVYLITKNDEGQYVLSYSTIPGSNPHQICSADVGKTHECRTEYTTEDQDVIVDNRGDLDEKLAQYINKPVRVTGYNDYAILYPHTNQRYLAFLMNTVASDSARTKHFLDEKSSIQFYASNSASIISSFNPKNNAQEVIVKTHPDLPGIQLNLTTHTVPESAGKTEGDYFLKDNPFLQEMELEWSYLDGRRVPRLDFNNDKNRTYYLKPSKASDTVVVLNAKTLDDSEESYHELIRVLGTVTIGE